ncbi:MAG: XdhC family protein [Ancalomicrobiaceae bacterium]|nr:XdhC family protein [Ancalomicrobiaceae bacterium]
MDLALLTELNEARLARQATIRVTDPNDGSERLVREATLRSDDPLHDELVARFRSAKSGLIDTPDGKRFLTVYVPPPRIVVIGAVHITQSLGPVAAIAGFDVTIIDPRTAFASEERFGEVKLVAKWPEDVIPAELALDPYTALIAVTHDPKIDDYPLKAALDAGCFYVGALGSRKTHAARVERLKTAGARAEAIARVAAPIGLTIGAQSPAEIAVAIVAQVIEALRLRPAHLAPMPADVWA